MRVVIAGGHGKVARLLQRELLDRGDQPVGIVRNPDHVDDLEALGSAGVLLDLEAASAHDLSEVLGGADAVVFAAGAGPGSGAARKETVDKGAAVLLADAAELAGVRRYVMVSSMGTEHADPVSDDVFQVYLRAKQAADDDLRRRGLDWTVVRPGGLTDAPGTGRVTVGNLAHAPIPRADVAAVVAECLHSPGTVGRTFDVVSGDVPVAEALRSM